MRNHYSSFLIRSLFLFLFFCCPTQGTSAMQDRPSIRGKIICLDPGHGGTATTDTFRQGPSGEREEWINLRVAFILKELLEKNGAQVIMTRTEDVFVPLADRATIAKENNADLFLSIHHNGTADPAVNFPIIYYHNNASENQASVALGKHIIQALNTTFYASKQPSGIISDHAIFPGSGAGVLRGTYGIPSVIAEASFFTNADEEKLLKDPAHNQKEAEALCTALKSFFSLPQLPILEKNSKIKISPFNVFQEAERTNDIALLWHEDFQEALKLMKSKDSTSLQQAYRLFSRSAHSFPDSYIAKECHLNRAMLLKKFGKQEESKEEKNRAKEHYVELD